MHFSFYTLKKKKKKKNNLEVNFVFDSLMFYPFSAFMLSTQLNYLIEEGTLAQNCICVLKRHVTNILKDGRYLFLWTF